MTSVPTILNVWTRKKLDNLIKTQNLAELKLLQQHKKIDFNHRDEAGFTVLHRCLFRSVETGSRKWVMLRYMLEQGGDPLEPDLKWHRDCVAWSLVLSEVGLLRMLLDRYRDRLDYNRPDSESSTYLHLAVASGRFDLVEAVAEPMHRYQLDMNRHNGVGLTATMLAYFHGFTDICELLESRFGAPRHRIDEFNGRTKTTLCRDGLTKKKRERADFIQREKDRCKIWGWDAASVRLPQISMSEGSGSDRRIVYCSDASQSSREWSYNVRAHLDNRPPSPTDTVTRRLLPVYMALRSRQMLPCVTADHVYDSNAGLRYQALQQRLYGARIAKNKSTKHVGRRKTRVEM